MRPARHEFTPERLAGGAYEHAVHLLRAQGVPGAEILVEVLRVVEHLGEVPHLRDVPAADRLLNAFAPENILAALVKLDVFHSDRPRLKEVASLNIDDMLVTADTLQARRC